MLSTNQQKTATAEQNETVHKAVLGTSRLQRVALGGGRAGRRQNLPCTHLAQVPLSWARQRPLESWSPYPDTTVTEAMAPKEASRRMKGCCRTQLGVETSLLSGRCPVPALLHSGALGLGCPGSSLFAQILPLPR